jgi:excinuclease ABC subunit B
VSKFRLKSEYKPTGDQPRAISQLTDGLNLGRQHQVLLGVTGSGKTFSMANVIANTQRPTLVLSHNKTLAAQLYNEFRQFFPDNAVHYFVSYFDYYQPEAYVPRTDTYIEKDSDINEEIDRLRHAATGALLSRRDVIIVASVSCIYGIGSVEDYTNMTIKIKRGERRLRDKLMRQLTDIQYRRNDMAFERGNFRVRGDVVDIFPAGDEAAYRIEFFGDEVEKMTRINPLTGEIEKKLTSLSIFPGSHFVTPEEKLKRAIIKIQAETEQRLKLFKQQGKLLEAQRLEQRVKFDIEMLEQTGFVKGIENYSRYLTDREPGEQPATLLDYFPDNYLMFVDESHMTIPQVRGMYHGDRSRKAVLVEHGFRLPSALDNRPLTFSEFERHMNQVIYVSATPAEYELSRGAEPVQQIIRPTGLLDPQIDVRKTAGQIDDLIAAIKDTVSKKQRVLVTTLTKRMSEDLAEYLADLNFKVMYLHSEIDTLERTDILRDLRLGVYDVLVGINLLREGLDLPEVSLVAILDADKEGFLRSEQSLIQTIGRAARHIDGRVLMYADTVTGSMRRAIDETNRRRQLQESYNQKHKIKPRSIQREVAEMLPRATKEDQVSKRMKIDLKKIPKEEYSYMIRDLTSQMDLAAANLEFEKAAELRDLIEEVKSKL